VWLLLLSNGAAWATTGHTFVGQFGGAGNSDGQFGEGNDVGPGGIAVMPSTGEVVTVDEARANRPFAVPRLQRFTADGVFVSSFPLDPSYEGGFSAVAVEDSSGAAYVASGFNGGIPSVLKYTAMGEVDYALDGSGAGFTISPRPYVAVDPADGSVYVTVTDSNGTPFIASFNSAGTFLDAFDGSTGSPDGGFSRFDPDVCPVPSLKLAVDGSHRVYVLDPCKNGSGRVDRYSSEGTFQATVDDGVTRGVPRAVAIDPVSDEVYVAEKDALLGLQITHFSVGGSSVVYTFDAADATDVQVMAVSGTGSVYTSDASEPIVERFTRFEGPAVVTGDASSVETRSAVLEGTINPEGVASSYHFEYGTDLKYGSRTADVGAGSGSGVAAASAFIDGLEPNKLYHFRIVGSNASGSIVGADGSFTTLMAPADVGPVFTSAITPRSARLHGTVNSNNFFTAAQFQYGTTTAYGNTGPLSFVSPGGAYQAVFSDVASLEPGTTYHFRLVADVFTGTPVIGADQTFLTAPAAGAGATHVTAGRAMLTGSINPHGVATTYHFNYGTTASYGASTPEVNGGSGDGDRPVSQEISGLSPDTTYHVQVVATSADGVIRAGGDGLFRTALAPTAEIIGPTGVSTDAATVAGEVNTFGLTGSYHFNIWSLDSSYAISTAERPVAGYTSAERVSTALSGLPAGETIVVQLSVTSNEASGVSDLATFATAELPRVFPSPPASDSASVYGCGSPRLDAYNGRPKPGEAIALTGNDLGVGGGVMLGDRPLKPADWSATAFRVSIPDDAAGTLALTVNCGRQSNTIAVAVFQEPDSRFAVTSRSVSGSTATLRVSVPGPGKLESAGASTKAAKVTVRKPGAATIKVKLTSAGTKALARAKGRARTMTVRIRFTPAGGRPASKTVAITFKRKGGR
jgi:hypothetical protein